MTGVAKQVGSAWGFGRLSRLWRRPNGQGIVLVAVSLIIAYLALVPLVTLIVSSFQSGFLSGSGTWTLANFQRLLSSSIFYRLLQVSLVYAISTTIIATSLGVALGWLYARTDMPLKGFAFATTLIPFVIPGVLYAISWVLLLSPKIGMFNAASNALFGGTLFDIYSMGGMILVEGLHNMPLAFLMSIAIFSSIDSSLEEAGFTAGHSSWGVFRKITLPLAWPGILGAALLIFIRAISGFEVPQLIGVPDRIFVFVTQIYSAVQSFPPNYGEASVIGDMLLLLCVAGLILSQRVAGVRGKYATITGKNFRPRPMSLGKWRWPAAGVFIAMFLLTGLSPLLAILWASFLPSYQVPSWEVMQRLTVENYIHVFTYPDILGAMFNSTIAAVSTGVLTMVLTTFAAYITIKTRIPGRQALDALVFVPIAMPGIIIGVGILFWYLVAPLPFNLYGSLTLLVIAFVTTHIPYGMRYMTAGMIQIDDELEEAGLVAGASWLTVFRRIYFPLLVPSLLAGFVYTLITVFREVSTAIFLYSPRSQLLSIAVYTLYENGSLSLAAAAGMLVFFLVTVLFVAVTWFSRRRGVSWSM